MKRLVILLGLLVITGLFVACGGGGGDDTNDVLALEVQFVAASPNAGTQPLRAVLTAVITGGKAPFYYAWDFTNDGSPDSFDNGQYSRTVNVAHEYFTRVSDGQEDSVYEVALTVTDSEGTVVTPDPISITVYAQGGIIVDPLGTGWTTDAADGLAYHGEPVQFNVSAAGGRAPYTYEWDFDNDGGTDSRIANPQHTFYYTGPKSFEIFRVGVIVTDADGQTLGTRDAFGNLKISDNVFSVPVAAPGYEFPIDEGYSITLASDPPSQEQPGELYEVIDIKFDPTQPEPGPIPMEPMLDLSVIVDPINGGGVQPYEYYWDFDNDGAIETQSPSPTIPYYDFSRKILMNPYTHTLNTKTFTLRCMVIDGMGRVENAYRTVVVQNTSSSVDLMVVPSYGVVLGDGSMGETYGAISDSDGDQDLRDEITNVEFNFAISGSTGVYDFQFDANGDGVPEIPAGGGYQPISGNQLKIDATTLAPFQGVGYFPAQIIIRSLQSGSPAQTVLKHVPVSLVGRKNVAYDGDLEVRAGHSAEATWTTGAGGANGPFLTSREMIIVGGAVGNTPLRNVEKVIETYPVGSPPAVEGDLEESEGLIATNRKPLLTPRKGSMIWAGVENYYVHGGESENDTIEASVEMIPFDDNDGSTPWERLNEINIYFPLKYAMGVKVTDLSTDIAPYGNFANTGMVFDALMFCGGVTQPQESDAEDTNGSIFFYRNAPKISEAPYWGEVDIDQLTLSSTDTYQNVGFPMITARHEGCAVFNPDNRLLYVIGGRTSDGGSTATVEVFDIDRRHWISLPPMNFPRAGGVAKYIGGRIYIMGGSYYPEDEGQQVVLETAEVYDPGTKIWSETVPPSLGTHQPSAAAMPGPGSVSTAGVNVNTIWYFGGSTDLGETKFFEEFVYFQDVPLAP